MAGNILGCYDLCIVGAGMFGSAAARYASSYPDLKVCLIGPEEPTAEEYKDRDIFGSHYDEGRIIGGNDNDTYVTLCKDSVKNFKMLEKYSANREVKVLNIINIGEMGEAGFFNEDLLFFLIQFYNPCGVLHMYGCTPDYFRRVSNCGEVEIEWLNISDSKIFSKKFPFIKLSEKYEAFFNAAGGYLSPRKLIEAEQKIAQQQGCEIISEVVTEIKETVDGMHEVITEVQSVLKASKILLCTGAFTNFNALFSGNKLDIAVNKETCVMVRISEEEALRLSFMPCIAIDHEIVPDQPKLHGAYILPPIKYLDDKYYLKIGFRGTTIDSELKSLEEIKNWFMCKGNKYVIDFYSKFLLKVLPGLKIEDIQGKTCVTCASPNEMPFVDQITPTVTVSAVGNGSGAAICEEIGRIAACLSIKGIWDSQISKNEFNAIFVKDK